MHGVSGIGKSKLSRAIRQYAEARSVETARSENFDLVRTPLGPFADILRELASDRVDVLPRAESDRQTLETLLGLRSPSSAPVDRRRLFVLLNDAFARASQHAPLCIEIDDAQWCDAESVEFAHYWAARISGTRICAILNVTIPHGSDDAPAIALSLDRFESVGTLRLGPLDGTALHVYAQSLVPIGRKLNGRPIDELCRRSEGNPLFLADLVRFALDGKHTNLPATVAQATHSAIEAIASESRRTIEVASILGKSFTIEDVVAMSGSSVREVLLAMRAARDAGFIDEIAGDTSTFVFTSELIREKIYDRTLGAERRLIHRNYAVHLELRSATPSQVAAHWAASGDLKHASPLYEISGDASLALGAFSTARDLFCDALHADLEPEHHARLAEKAARTFDALGEIGRALENVDEALSHWSATTDTRRIVALQLWRSHLLYRSGRPEEALAACEAVLSSPEIDHAERFEAQVFFATFFAFREDFVRAASEIARADALLLGRTPFEELRLEWARAIVAFGSGDSETWQAPARKALTLAEQDKPATLALTASNYAVMARGMGRYDLADVALTKAIDTSDRNGLTLAAGFARTKSIEHDYARGKLAKARSTLFELLGLHVDAPIVRVNAAAYGIPVLVDIDEMDLCPSLLDRALLDLAFESKESSRYAPLAAAHAYFSAANHEQDRAVLIADRALDAIESTTQCAAAVVTLAWFGEERHARRAVNLFERTKLRGEDGMYASLARAIAAKHDGDWKSRDRHCHDALVVAERLGLRVATALTFEIAGRNQDAITAYESYGAKIPARRIGKPKDGRLTKREDEVARLLGQGLSNRAIAEQLTLSERTVENHIAAIYAKTGVKNRAEFLTRKFT